MCCGENPLIVDQNSSTKLFAGIRGYKGDHPGILPDLRLLPAHNPGLVAVHAAADALAGVVGAVAVAVDGAAGAGDPSSAPRHRVVAALCVRSEDLY